MSPACAHCPHAKEQHDEDGFCDIEDKDTGFCECPGYEPKESQGEHAE